MIKKIIIVIVIFYVLSHLYNNFFTPGMITGTYKNTNFAQSPIAPNRPDRLVLHKNNTYSSEYSGKGIYKISYSIRGTKITLSNFIGMPYETSIERIWYGKPKIIIFSDLGHYYNKE
ncbi:hypothetical protein [Emticicia sp. C21]|uniref:hypothetical protein n=1 Tax=Emticicia sp. C21 TaxID=2302915 RepID=UPI000E84046F|nr:hypothetical protein [Emticicia sp. C21]RFS16900.1 hypothetical protein D0T08_09490 [Emticicia sp. C21]